MMASSLVLVGLAAEVRVEQHADTGAEAGVGAGPDQHGVAEGRAQVVQAVEVGVQPAGRQTRSQGQTGSIKVRDVREGTGSKRARTTQCHQGERAA